MGLRKFIVDDHPDESAGLGFGQVDFVEDVMSTGPVAVAHGEIDLVPLSPRPDMLDVRVPDILKQVLGQEVAGGGIRDLQAGQDGVGESTVRPVPFPQIEL